MTFDNTDGQVLRIELESVATQSDTSSQVYLCGACQRLGRCRMGIEWEYLDPDGNALYRLECSRENEGGANVAHGGWTAGVLDEIVGHVAVLRGRLAVTGTLQVKFVKPVPIEQALTARATLDRIEGSRWYVDAVLELESSGAELARATAILVSRDEGHFDRHEEWMRTQTRKDSDGAS